MTRKTSITKNDNCNNENKITYSELELIEEKIKISFLKNAIEEGLKSGRAKDFNSQKHLESLKIKKRTEMR